MDDLNALERQITGQLEHPGVVPVHEIGNDEHGQVYFTMRLVGGREKNGCFHGVRRDRKTGTERDRPVER